MSGPPDPPALVYEAPNRVADAVWRACIAELEAPKPGNVSFASSGHGMTAADFVASARCCADALGHPGWSLGERIYRAVAATRDAVGCNTNLGVVLLCAPLAQAALDGGHPTALRDGLARVLAAAGVDDTQRVFDAIRLAAPGGLGASAHHDVAAPASAPLVVAMRAAEGRDRVARQYARGFEDVFDFGRDALARSRARSGGPRAVVGLYLAFLSRFADSHVERQFGRGVAEHVRCEAQLLVERLDAPASPDADAELLARFDRSLKRREINPGTSADLTVATLLADLLLDVSRDV